MRHYSNDVNYILIQPDLNRYRSGAWKYRNGPEQTGTDPNAQWNGPERTRMDSGMDRNGPEDTMKSLALHPLFDIRIEKSLNIFI